MTKEQLWKIYTDKNPHWLEIGANLTPCGLKKLFDETYSVGFKRGVNFEKNKNNFTKKDTFDEFFKGFGTK